jgi:hypothetical protein
MKKLRKLFDHVFMGNKYRVFETPSKPKNILGVCEPPTAKNRKMEIPIGYGPNILNVQIHEGIHACAFILDEPTVDRMSSDIARLLWRIGWRNVSVPKSEGGQF